MHIYMLILKLMAAGTPYVEVPHVFKSMQECTQKLVDLKRELKETNSEGDLECVAGKVE